MNDNMYTHQCNKFSPDPRHCQCFRAFVCRRDRDWNPHRPARPAALAESWTRKAFLYYSYDCTSTSGARDRALLNRGPPGRVPFLTQRAFNGSGGSPRKWGTACTSTSTIVNLQARPLAHRVIDLNSKKAERLVTPGPQFAIPEKPRVV